MNDSALHTVYDNIFDTKFGSVEATDQCYLSTWPGCLSVGLLRIKELLKRFALSGYCSAQMQLHLCPLPSGNNAKHVTHCRPPLFSPQLAWALTVECCVEGVISEDPIKQTLSARWGLKTMV